MTVKLRESTTPLAALEERMNGEAEARSSMAAQIHELAEFAVSTVEEVETLDSRLVLVAEKLGELARIVGTVAEETDRRLNAITVALQALTPPPQRKRSLLRKVVDWINLNEYGH